MVDAFTDVDSNQAVLELLGDGREKVALQERVSERGLQNVRFHDFLPVEEAFHFVAGCDVGIVSLRPEIYRYAFPAKFYTYIGAGIPMLVFVEHESELATIVNEREIGVVVGWDDGKDAARKAVEELVRNYDTYQANIYENTDDLYLPSRARKEWLELFRSLDKVA